MRIWIDLANAPHVAFFLPIIRELDRRGNSTVITMRDFNQTVELAHENSLSGRVIGTHGGKSSLGKMVNLFGRSGKLASSMKRASIDVAVSHNSYTQTIAGRLIGARVVTIMDYEGQPANHIAFRLAHRVIVPSAFPQADLHRFGCAERKVARYRGFKEQVYLSDFRPDPGFARTFARACGLKDGWSPERTVIVTVRTPATMAAYHRFENDLFEKFLEMLDNHPDLTVVLLPRTSDQRIYYREKYPRVLIPEQPLPGSDLVSFSDLVVSAGGTMNREAAILGTPVCTIFAGQLPAVDRSLIEMGRLSAIQSQGDLDRLPLRKKEHGRTLDNPALCNEIVDLILSR